MPKSIRDLPIFGGRRLYTKTLETGDLREAQRKRDLIIANFEHLAAQAEEAPKRQRFNAYIEEIQQAVRGAEHKCGSALLPKGQEIEAALGRGNAELADVIKHVQQGQKQHQAQPVITLKEAAAAFIKAETVKAEKGQKATGRATLSRVKTSADSLAVFLGKPAVLLKDIERRDVTLWLASLAGDKSDSTRTGYLAALSIVWESRYLLRDVDGDNPFRNAKFQSVGDQESYAPFAVEELAVILEKAPPELITLTKFGLVTGCRLGEILALQVGDFEISHGVHLVQIRTGKTASSVRGFPLPFNLWEELKECAKKQLWASTGKTPPANRWSKRFSDLKVAAIGEKGAAKAFHSLRGMAITAYQRAGIPEDVTAPIVGHGTKGLTLSYGLYSSGYDCSHQLEAVEKMLAGEYMQSFLKLFNQ